MKKAKEHWKGVQCSEIEENLRKGAHQLVKDLTTTAVKQGEVSWSQQHPSRTGPGR